ncbi:MAG: signal peptide peptidase SppA [Deltaproteobacteria bacterium]|nr:signal peptide peptidase SppA [Deltaproteobacteria bacterium]
MATRKHPLLIGIVGVVIALALFFVLVLSVSFFMARKGDILPSEKIGVVPVKGVITDAQSIIDQLRKFRKNQNIKAIVVRIDSPGGGVGPAQEIYREIKKIRQEKEVFASIGSIAASGGYYVACATSKIIANPGSITGSIGVIVEYANIEELMEKIGLKGVVIKSGKYKDILSPFREMSEEERDLIQNVTDSIHDQFISSVAEGRNLEKAQVAAIADGRIFTGLHAQEMGLVDAIGNFYDAIDIAAESVGITGEPEIVYPEKRLSLFDYLFEEVSQRWGQYLCFPYRFRYLSPLQPE